MELKRKESGSYSRRKWNSMYNVNKQYVYMYMYIRLESWTFLAKINKLPAIKWPQNHRDRWRKQTISNVYATWLCRRYAFCSKNEKDIIEINIKVHGYNIVIIVTYVCMERRYRIGFDQNWSPNIKTIFKRRYEAKKSVCRKPKKGPAQKLNKKIFCLEGTRVWMHVIEKLYINMWKHI